MTRGIPERVPRWTAKRRSALVLSLLEGESRRARRPANKEMTMDRILKIQRWFAHPLHGPLGAELGVP